MVIEFPLKHRATAAQEDDYERKLALILPYRDRPEALCQLLADCLVRLDRLEGEAFAARPA